MTAKALLIRGALIACAALPLSGCLAVAATGRTRAPAPSGEVGTGSPPGRRVSQRFSAQLSPMVGRETTMRDRPGNAGLSRSAK